MKANAWIQPGKQIERRTIECTHENARKQCWEGRKRFSPAIASSPSPLSLSLLLPTSNFTFACEWERERVEAKERVQRSSREFLLFSRFGIATLLGTFYPRYKLGSGTFVASDRLAFLVTRRSIMDGVRPTIAKRREGRLCLHKNFSRKLAKVISMLLASLPSFSNGWRSKFVCFE